MDLYYQENHRPTRPMTYDGAIKTCLVKSGDMNGRGTRSEFWSFFLFYLPMMPALYVLDLSLIHI